MTSAEAMFGLRVHSPGDRQTQTHARKVLHLCHAGEAPGHCHSITGWHDRTGTFRRHLQELFSVCQKKLFLVSLFSEHRWRSRWGGLRGGGSLLTGAINRRAGQTQRTDRADLRDNRSGAHLSGRGGNEHVSSFCFSLRSVLLRLRSHLARVGTRLGTRQSRFNYIPPIHFRRRMRNMWSNTRL